MNSSKIAYRPEIDGLRAIAVISVIFYHAQIEFLSIRFMKGGFFGVDIFFIISGYLITRIILFEIKNNNFSILKFYMRRARRILPMLYTIIIASIPFAWQKLLPFDFILYAKSIFASLFFGSNFFFYFSSIQYATESALLKPLLHTWSLGIEEQFYLIFPILTILCYKFFRQFYFFIITILFLLSLCFAQSIVIQNPNFNFYLLFSRFWELAAGSMLAYRELNYNSSKKTNRNYMFSILGLILIIWSILFFDNMTPHPSLYTVLPIIGTVLIVRFSTKNSLVTKLLSIKPLVFVGLISYSAYLWHYPIFAFSRMGGPLIIYDKIFLIILTIIFSIISFFFIEKPFRNPKKITNKVFLKLLFFFTVCIITFSFFIIKTDGFKNRIKNTIAENMSDVEWNKLQKLPYKPLNDILASKEKNNLISSCYKKKRRS